MLGVPDGTEITVQPLDEDRFGYYFQPVEIDARAYAAEETERLQGLIDKELQKETSQEKQSVPQKGSALLFQYSRNVGSAV